MINQEDQSRTTREQVLQTLLSREQCTINELAEVVEINPISVRHHITKLQAAGLVDSIEERHGVGRPRRLYYLTERGREHFPQRYIRLTSRLLDQLKETMPLPMVNQLFTQMAEDLAHGYKEELEELTIEERLDLIRDLLTKEGFTVDWEQMGDTYQIREISCPYYHIGRHHPEICTIDQTIISTILNVPAKKIQCKLNGDAHCTFVFTDADITEKQEA